MGKLQLKQKPQPTTKGTPAILKQLLRKKPVLSGVKIYASDYAVTDNLNFIIFGITDQFLLDNFIQDDILGFNFSEESVDMRIDRTTSLQPIISADTVSFANLGCIQKTIYDLIVLKSPRCTFLPVVEWFGESVNSLVCCISESGKLVAVVKTV